MMARGSGPNLENDTERKKRARRKEAQADRGDEPGEVSARETAKIPKSLDGARKREMADPRGKG